MSLKKLLIISPSFPPVNAADMHRVRQSVSYFEALGWKPTVVVVEPAHNESVIDPLLAETLPEELNIIEVKAFSTRWTRKLGLGSLALRSLWFYFRKVNRLLEQERFDLIYFSTTMFPVMILGAYWKKRFGVPYVLDMQDPWHTDHYLSVPKDQRPAKFWFSYRLNKYLEPIAMKSVDAIIAVSQGYCDVLQERYSNIRPHMCSVIPFGAFPRDFEVLRKKETGNQFFTPGDGYVHIVYVGAVHNMHQSTNLIFDAFELGLAREKEVFGKIRLHFIGTSYAPGRLAKAVMLPVAEAKNAAAYVQEYPNRIPYFDTLRLLQESDMLLMFGNDDTQYTASKLYPYIMARKPILAAFSQYSSVVRILRATGAGEVVTFDGGQLREDLVEHTYRTWSAMLRRLPFTPPTDWQAFEPYMAREMTSRQVDVFNAVVGEPVYAHSQMGPQTGKVLCE